MRGVGPLRLAPLQQQHAAPDRNYVTVRWLVAAGTAELFSCRAHMDMPCAAVCARLAHI